MALDREDWERLQEIHAEMNDLLEEAKNLVRLSGNRFEYERATAYWIAYVDNALAGPRFPLLACTMGDTIRALEPEETDEDDEGDVEDEVPDNERAGGPDTGDTEVDPLPD